MHWLSGFCLLKEVFEEACFGVGMDRIIFDFVIK
jgi:hypothetical protein